MANSFKWDGATIRVKQELTIADDDAISTLMSRLGDSNDKNAGGRYRFAEFMIAAEIEGELPLSMVTSKSSDTEIHESFDAWRKLKRTFVKQWQATLQEAENDPNE